MKKILIAEDNISHLIILKKLLVLEGYEVLTARNGREALETLGSHPVDCVLTDWMMPEMDGIELIRRIRESVRPNPMIVMVTALVSDDVRWRAISSGADDYISKPYDRYTIVATLERLAVRKNQSITVSRTPERIVKQERPPFIGIAVAASTGGPDTLLRFFSGLPVLSGAAIYVVLHGPAWMLKTMVGHIQKKTSMTVRLAEDGMKTRAGEIYLAPGDLHTVVENDTLILRLNDDPPENYVRPAADPLFRSVAIAFGAQSIGIIMTGMGHDGTVGCGYISAGGGVVIVQDPSTAVIASMPQTVVSLGLANEIATIAQIPGIVEKHVLSLRRR
jgi:two-component system chemotaxis response regulator CheB